MQFYVLELEVGSPHETSYMSMDPTLIWGEDRLPKVPGLWMVYRQSPMATSLPGRSPRVWERIGGHRLFWKRSPRLGNISSRQPRRGRYAGRR